MKNLCRVLLIAGVLALTGGGHLTVKAATPVTDISDMLSGGTGSREIYPTSYILNANVGDRGNYRIDGHTSIDLNSYKFDGILYKFGSFNYNLTISGSGEVGGIIYESGGACTQSGGTVLFAQVAHGVEYHLTGGELKGLALDEGTFSQSGGEVTGGVEICYRASVATSGNYILSGGRISGDIGIGNGSLTVSGTGEITGDIDLAGGTLTVNGGTISGDITLNGGTLVNNGGTITGSIIDPSSSGSSSSGSSSRRSSDKKSTHKKHTTASDDFYYDELGRYGGLIDGVFAPTTMIPASAYPKFNSFLVKKLQATEAGSTLSVNADPWTSINKAVADAFTEKGDIGLAIKYTQGGVPLQVTIPAGTNLSEQLDENGYIGFPKLAQLYGAAPVTQ